MRPKTLFGIAAIGLFGFFVVNSFGDQVSGYESFTEAAASGRRAHVVGTWDRTGPTSYDRDRNVFTFQMADENGTVFPVTYANPKPANFEDAEKVVVEGQMADGTFEAEHILVKCPSKYNDGRGFEPAEPGSAEASTVTASAAEGSAAE